MKSLIVSGENFVNDQNDYTVTSGDGTKDKLYDQKQATQWVSSGSAEGVYISIQIDFKDRVGTPVSRTIDRLVFLNCNLAKFIVRYWDGAAWQDITESDFTGVANTETNVYIEMAAPVTTLRLMIVATNTIGAVAEKAIGEFKACLLVVSLRHIVNVNRKNWDNGGSYRLYGGSLVGFRDVVKFEASIGIEQMNITSYELIIDLIQDRDWMTWILYEDFRRADIYEVKATAQPSEQLDKKMQLYSLSFPVKER